MAATKLRFRAIGSGSYEVWRSDERVGVVERHPMNPKRWTYRMDWEGSRVIEVTDDGMRSYATRADAAKGLLKEQRAYQKPIEPLPKKTTRRRKR